MNLFREFWKGINNTSVFAKSEALTKSEIDEVQKKIAELQAKGLPSSKIITTLQKFNSKLGDRYKAERAYWTETKRMDTEAIGEIGEDLGISKYKAILSPSACKLCREKTNNGARIFKNADIEKTGWGYVPPFHPQCYCILIPIE